MGKVAAAKSARRATPASQPETRTQTPSSFRAIETKAELAAETFFGKLFVTHPELRPCFAKQLAEHKAGLAETLRQAGKHSGRLGREEVRGAWAGHQVEGLRPDHAPVIRDTLIATLKYLVGAGWDESEWRDAAAALVAAMTAEKNRKPVPGSATKSRVPHQAAERTRRAA